MKKKLAVLLIFLFAVSCKHQNDKVDILVTIYPFKFILQQLVKDELRIDVLLPASVDPHTYELVPSDLIKAQNAELFIYCDKDLDGWAAKIETKNKIQLSDYLPDSLRLNITYTNNLTHTQTHSHNLNPPTSSHHSHHGFDPHFWTDPVTIKAMVDNIADLLIKHFPTLEKNIIKNSEAFKVKLNELDSIVSSKTRIIEKKNIFTSHPFYNYFFKRYDFNIVGFLEVSPGQVLSPKEMKLVMDLVKSNNVKAIFTNKQHNDKTTKILAESVGIKHYDLDPIGGTENQKDYFSIINYNLDIIIQALK